MTKKKKHAVVTGSEGFIGSYLVRFLEAKGWNVVGTYLTPPCSSTLKSLALRFTECDLLDARRVDEVLRECQPTHIFHLGAQSLPKVSWENPIGTFEANVMGSLYLLESVRRMKRPPVIVSACSSAEYGHVPPSAIPVREEQPLHPLHPYGISKVCLDLLAREYYLDYKIPAVNLRVFNTTGPGKMNDAASDFVRQLVRIKKGIQSPVLEVGNLTPYRALLDVRDTVRGFYLAALRGKRGESYNICASKTHRVSTILSTAIRLSGVHAEIRPVERLMRPSDEKIIFGNTAKFRRDTGWKPVISLEQTLSSMLQYWDRHLES